MDVRRSPGRAFVGRLAIALLASTLVMTGLVLGVNREIDRKLNRIPRIPLDTAAPPPDGANYLLVGSDTRQCSSGDTFNDGFVGDSQRSDTIMVVHVEPKAERTLVVSFPRDLYVTVRGQGQTRINAAFARGPQGVIDALADNFGIEIHHYIQLDFCSFMGIVDEVGLVPTYLPYLARDLQTGFGPDHAGCLFLNGEVALQYVRSRQLQYRDDRTGRWEDADPIPDIGRIGRQQEFMRKLAGLAVAKSLDNPFTANNVADEVVGNLKADEGFTSSDAKALIRAFRTINPDDQSSLEFATIPWTGGPLTPAGESVLYRVKALESAILERLSTFSDQTPTRIDPATVKLRFTNASGRVNLAEATRDGLVALGFVGGPASESTKRLDQTQVRYSPDAVGALEKAKLVLRYLDPAARLVPKGVAGADVEIVLGRDFRAILTPTDAAPPGTTTTAGPAVEEPAPTTTTTVPAVQGAISRFPAPAPREGC
jgi:LCP family protein required for cell wall assembly